MQYFYEQSIQLSRSHDVCKTQHGTIIQQQIQVNQKVLFIIELLPEIFKAKEDTLKQKKEDVVQIGVKSVYIKQRQLLNQLQGINEQRELEKIQIFQQQQNYFQKVKKNCDKLIQKLKNGKLETIKSKHVQSSNNLDLSIKKKNQKHDKNKKKPLWSLTKQEYEQSKKQNEKDLENFMENLDYEKFEQNFESNIESNILDNTSIVLSEQNDDQEQLIQKSDVSQQEERLQQSEILFQDLQQEQTNNKIQDDFNMKMSADQEQQNQYENKENLFQNSQTNFAKKENNQCNQISYQIQKEQKNDINKKDFFKARKIIKENLVFQKVYFQNTLCIVNKNDAKKHTLMPDFKLNPIQEGSEESLLTEKQNESNINIQLSSGTNFDGKVKENKLQGKGLLKFQDDEFGKAEFKGKFLRNKANGYCELLLNDKLIFKGNFQNQQVNGIGELIDNDLLYMGQWQKNKYNGYGRVIKKDFAIYEGQFRNGNREGLGIELYTNSDLYIGEFSQDQKHGFGIYFFKKKNYFYKGQFYNNKRKGYGQIHSDKNLQYKGQWNNDQKNGYGKEWYKNGSQYQGYFVSNTREGSGMMIYNESLNYIGEWKNNKQNGLGKITLNNQTISGKFKDNNLQNAQSVDIGHIIQTLQQDIKEYKYVQKQINIQEQSELFKVIKEKLKDLVYQFAVEGILKIEIYLIIKNIFGSLNFEDTLYQIQKQLIGQQNSEDFYQIWNQQQIDMRAQELQLQWNQWQIQKKLSDDFWIVQLTKINQGFPMTLSESMITGEFQNKNLQGGILDNKLYVHLFENEEIQETCRGIVYPNFIHLNKETIVSLNMNKYKGYFIFNREKKNKKDLTIFLHIKSGLIYSFGIDMVGTFVITGYYNYEEKRAKFVQKYSQDYEIFYDIFSFDFNKMFGYWSTTNIRGYFEIYRDEDYNQNQDILNTVEQKYSGKFDPLKLNQLKSQSVLCVILNKTVKKDEERKFLDSLNLNRINRKKKQTLKQLDNRPKSKTTYLNYTVQPELTGKIATSQLLEEKFSELNKDQMSHKKQSYQEERVFLRRISKMLSRIGVNSKHQKEQQVNVSDNFIWIGTLQTLGKTENIIIKNLYIKNNLQIEGVFLFQSQIYELYGQYKGENKEIEIMGFSINQKYSLRIIGELKENKVSGKLYSSKINLPESQINLQFQAEQIFVEYRLDGITYQKSRCMWKQIRGYIFAMVFQKKQVWFIKGKDDIKLGIQLEIFSSIQPQIKCSLQEVFSDEQKNIKIFKKEQDYLKVFFNQNFITNFTSVIVKIAKFYNKKILQFYLEF